MRFALTFIFGTIPVLVLGLLAFVPLIAGVSALLDYPSVGSLLIVWAAAGFFGSVSMLQAAGGRYGSNTTPGLLAGIAAAAPLAFFSLSDPDFPETLFFGYWTISPILVATWYLAEQFLIPGKSRLKDESPGAFVVETDVPGQGAIE